MQRLSFVHIVIFVCLFVSVRAEAQPYTRGAFSSDEESRSCGGSMGKASAVLSALRRTEVVLFDSDANPHRVRLSLREAMALSRGEPISRFRHVSPADADSTGVFHLDQKPANVRVELRGPMFRGTDEELIEHHRSAAQAHLSASRLLPFVANVNHYIELVEERDAHGQESGEELERLTWALFSSIESFVEREGQEKSQARLDLERIFYFLNPMERQDLFHRIRVVIETFKKEAEKLSDTPEVIAFRQLPDEVMREISQGSVGQRERWLRTLEDFESQLMILYRSAAPAQYGSIDWEGLWDEQTQNRRSY